MARATWIDGTPVARWTRKGARYTFYLTDVRRMTVLA